MIASLQNHDARECFRTTSRAPFDATSTGDSRGSGRPPAFPEANLHPRFIRHPPRFSRCCRYATRLFEQRSPRSRSLQCLPPCPGSMTQQQPPTDQTPKHRYSESRHTHTRQHCTLGAPSRRLHLIRHRIRKQAQSRKERPPRDYSPGAAPCASPRPQDRTTRATGSGRKPSI